jgi:hypothetical protein
MSNINPQSIDGTYPIAGQDNNSQGFRDNFTNTVNNFTFAAAELTDLQNNAVLKAALGSVGQTGTPTNDMNYAYLTRPQIKGAVETKNAIGNVTSGTFNVDWSTGHFQTVELVGTSASLTFPSTWPATNLYTRLRLQVSTYTNVCALTLPAAVSTNISSIQGASGQVVTLPAGEVYVFEFTTWNNGATVAIQDVLRNYDITANGASTTFTTVTAGRVNSGFVGNVGTVITGAGISANTLNISGNIIGGLTQLAAINNTPIGNATASTGAFSTLSATGTLTATGITILTGGVSGNVVINDPIGGGSFGSNLTVKGTVEFKSQDQSNNASVNTSTKSLTLAPGGDQFVLININGNCSIGYNATITPGHQTTVHVKNSAGALAYVIVPNANTNTGNAFIGLDTGITGTFVFTSYGTDAGNVFVTVSR